MGQKETKFGGQGKVLGTGEVVNAPKRSSLFPPVSAAAQKAGQSTLGVSVRATKSKPALTENEKEERRKAAAAAAQAREKAWEERLAKQRLKHEKQEHDDIAKGRAWNELSPAPELPPADPEFLRKQKEASEKLAKSGFNPFQATVSNSTTARSIITNMNIDDNGAQSVGTPSIENPSIETMQRARTQLKTSMQGSDAKALKAALVEAEKYDVPEVEEARELLDALMLHTSEERDEGDFEQVISAVELFKYAVDAVEKKRAAQNTIQTLLRNLVEHPENPKYRKIRLENKAIKEKIVDVASGTAVAILQAVGFEQITDEDGEVCLVVPDPSTLPAEVVTYARQSCNVALGKLQALEIQ